MVQLLKTADAIGPTGRLLCKPALMILVPATPWRTQRRASQPARCAKFLIGNVGQPTDGGGGGTAAIAAHLHLDVLKEPIDEQGKTGR
jgi:hypothetical protein